MARDGLQYRALSLGLVSAAAIVLTLLLLGNASGVGIGFIRHHPGFATPTPTSTSTPVAGLANDEFNGPFNSWVNVHNAPYNADNTGATDASAAINSAISASIGNTIYLPAGTYKITSPLAVTTKLGTRIIGADPATTKILWGGSVGGTMMNIAGMGQGEISRITWDANAAAKAGIILGFGSVTATNGATSPLLLSDNIFKNASIEAVRSSIAGAGFQDSEFTFLRDEWLSNATGLLVNNANSLDMYVWYNQFVGNGVGMDNGSAHGGWLSENNFFSGSTTADLQISSSMEFFNINNNVSIGSNRFLSAPSNNSLVFVRLQGNRIVNTTQPAAINLLFNGPATFIDNQIKSAGTAGPAISMSPPGGSTVAAVSIGNQFSVASGAESIGGSNPGVLAISDTSGVGTISTASPISACPNSSGFCHAPQVARTVIEPSARTGAAIQTAVTTACTSPNLGNRTVVHLPGGAHYAVSSTISIPLGCDVQIIGDGLGGPSGASNNTTLDWSGSTTAIEIHSQSKAVLRDFAIQASGTGDMIKVDSADVPGSRVNIWNEFNGPYTGNARLEAQGLTNTLINNYSDSGEMGYNYDINVIGDGSLSSPSRVASWDGGGGDANISRPVSTTKMVDHVTGAGTLIVMGQWIETTEPYFLINEQNESGNVAVIGNWAGYINQNRVTEQYNNFSGTALINSHLIQAGIINATNNPGIILNAGNGGYGECESAWTNTGNTAFGALKNLYSASNLTSPPCTGVTPAPDVGSLTSAQVLSAFARLRAVAPMPDTALPAGVDEVDLCKINLTNSGTTKYNDSIHIVKAP